MVPTDFLPLQRPQLPQEPQTWGFQAEALREDGPPVSSMDPELPHLMAEFVRLFREQDLVLPLEPKYRCVGVRGQG